MSSAPAFPCEGCGAPLGVLEAQRWAVCMTCTRARHHAVIAGRCVCGRSRVPGEPVSQAGRRWTPCRRCLGAIAGKEVA
jgi:hypothetical protein